MGRINGSIRWGGYPHHRQGTCRQGARTSAWTRLFCVTGAGAVDRYTSLFLRENGE